MSFRPKILITNDDGIDAPGIKHLWNALKNIADITIIAPATEQSAVGLSITLRSPLRLQKIDWPEDAAVWSVSGTPADCVKLGLSVVLKEKPDLVVSGINRGSNAGRNVLYSGTVGGAIEGALRDIPGVAFSCVDMLQPNYESTEKYIPYIVQHVLDHKLPLGTILNVNFPPKSLEIKGLKLVRQGREFWTENPSQRFHPVEGHAYYWLGAKLVQFDEEEDTDISWLQHGYITAVPVHIGELTDHGHLEKHKSVFENLLG